MAFTIPIKIRFQHCDPAGIVFYPRYFEMFNLVVEEWFEQVIQTSFNQLHSQQGIGTPMARMEVDFRAMSRLEDIVDFSLTVDHIGNSSLKGTIRATCNEELRCSAKITLVCVDLKTSKSIAWPAFIRPKIQQFVEDNQ